MSKEKDIYCKYCLRKLPNKSFVLGKKCIWCDGEYHSTKMEAKNG